jgi:hypothetical protein
MPRYAKRSPEQATYRQLQKLAKAAPVGSKARERAKVAQPSQGYAYPTLTLRQLEIVLACIELGMVVNADEAADHLEAMQIHGDEWQDLIRALFRE